jgi:hypothetical protein
VETLKGYLVAAEEGKFHVSEKVKAFWRTKLASHEELLQVLEPIGNEELKKQYLEKACSYLIAFRPSVMVRTTRELTLATSENVLAPSMGLLRLDPHPSELSLQMTPMRSYVTCVHCLVSRKVTDRNVYLYSRVSKVTYGKHVLILPRALKCQMICFYLSHITELQDREGEWSRGLAPCAVTIAVCI